jgi:PAS domain S-box-containing protein
MQDKYRQSEDILRVITAQYQHIAEAMSDYIFSVHIVDGNPVRTVHGPTCKTITGYSPEEFSINPWLWIQMVHEEDRAAVVKYVEEIVSGHSVKPLEHRIVHKDGTIRWVRNMPACQYDETGKLIAYDGLIQDITERKIAEEALRRSEEKYRIVAEFTYDWEYWLDSDGHYIYVSPSCERVTGYSPDLFSADPDLLTKITHPD